MVASSTDHNIPTVTVVDSNEPIRNDKKIARICCGCIPERVGVFAILSVYFFLGIFTSLAAFVGLGLSHDITGILINAINGFLNATMAIVSALTANAIRKEKVVMMRRLSVAFCIVITLILTFNITAYILEVVFRSSEIKVCLDDAKIYDSGNDANTTCERIVNETLTSEGVKTFVTGITSIYFAYVIFRYAKIMEGTQNLPFAVPVDGQNTPTYTVYSTQPPTSNDWVPPPTYTVRPTNPLPSDFNPDSKQISN